MWPCRKGSAAAPMLLKNTVPQSTASSPIASAIGQSASLPIATYTAHSWHDGLNFAAGIWGLVLAVFGFFTMSPVLDQIIKAGSKGIEFLTDNSLLPFTSFIIEPAKVLFLNNAINHGILTPLGAADVADAGKSVLFLLEANPAAGAGLLLAYTFFGKGVAKSSAPGALIIHFLGGIHEIYFPYVLM